MRKVRLGGGDEEGEIGGMRSLGLYKSEGTF